MSLKLLLTKCAVHPRLACWLLALGALTGLALGVLLERSYLEQRFTEDAERVVEHVSKNIHRYDIALGGFAHFLTQTNNSSDEQIRAYARGIRELFPGIYAFEISRQVPGEQKVMFERRMRARGYPEFRIHGFNYKTRETVTDLPQREDYYPIFFIEPQTENNRQVLGLDLGYGSSVLVETILEAASDPSPIASRPFTLMEGGKGYVLYRPVKMAGPQAPMDFAMLVVSAGHLLPEWLWQDARYAVSLSAISPLAGNVEKYLIEPTSVESAAIWQWSHKEAIESQSQPFTLRLERHVNLAELHWYSIISWLVAVGLLGYWLGLKLNALATRQERERRELRSLYLKANYDHLTGLPNLNLFKDMAEQMLEQARRRNGLCGLLYLDLDHFKSINDQYGHLVGDQCLYQFAKKLKELLRGEDIPARLHGDEFAVLLPDLSSQRAAIIVIEKILAELSVPLEVEGRKHQLRCSIGLAVYPEDGQNLQALLKVADKKMYLAKRV